MDVNKLFTKIKELGHVNSRRDELREYCKLKIDQILKFLPRRIVNSDGGDVLDCILNGLSCNLTSSKNKVKIIDIVLQVMRKESTSLTHCGDVITRLCLELPRIPSPDLLRWSNDCIQSIIEDSDVNMIWKDVLPESLSALQSHINVTHCGTEMTVLEYKEQCVRTLCQCRWTEKQLVQLTAMFKDMQLQRNDHKQVVNKICSYMMDIPPETLPPLVHQLLKLCKTYDMEIVLAHLSHYFSVRLYSRLEPPPPDSESTTMDIDDIGQHCPAELSRCLSTCLYHLTSGAEPELIRRHVKSWPRSQLRRNPFLIDLAVALQDKGADFRTVCLDVIRSAIEQRLTDELRSKESSWTRSVLPPDVDIASVLKVLTTESANHRQLTVMGLMNLAFCLLSVPRSKPVALASWSLGKLVAARLSKAQPETAPHLLARLADCLVQDHTQRQYADCLQVLCTLTPVSIERCTQLTTILENCQPVPGDYKSAAAVFDAVHPLINFSTRVRDVLVMVCRKGLYSRDSTHRCLALSGFLTVLRHVKISRTFSCSQSASEQYSAHSYLTQLTVDVHAEQNGSQVTSRVRNEAMCMEVVSILRRCLVQDAAVKELLYTKIYDCAKEKPVLHEPILELLYEHMSKYLPDDDADTSPILFDKCVQITPVTAVLTEPIARLLYVTAQFLQPVEEEDLEDILASQSPDTGSAHLKSKLGSVLTKLSQCARLDTVNMDNLTDLTPESKAKSLKVQQMLSCYEVLVAHHLMQWNSSSQSYAEIVFSLFNAHSQLLDQAKAVPKIGKKSSKSTLNETRETVKSQKSQKSQKDKGKGPMKMSNLVKDRAGPFKPLPCVWDLKLCLRLMEFLYNESVPWSSLEQRNYLRGKSAFHQWCVRGVSSALAQRAERRNWRDVANIAAVLYHRVVCRFQTMSDFDEQTALGCVDLFRECISTLLSPHYSLKLESFLTVIADIPDGTSSACIAAILEQLHSALRLIEEESVAEERDAANRKLVTSLVQTTGVLLETHVPCSLETIRVLTKLEDYVRASKQDCLSLIPPLLTASHREQRDAKFLDDLLLKLKSALGKIDEDDTSSGGDEIPMFPAIDSRTGHTVFAYICTHLTSRHKCIEHLLHRARDLSNALAVVVQGHQGRIDKELKELYKCITLQLGELSRWTCAVGALRCSVGGDGSERALTACLRLYALLATTAKQIDPPTAQIVRFDRLLKLCGKKYSTVTDNLITYLEASQQQQSANKVLRETKLIPRLVLEAEMFSKHVIVLAGKAKVNYQQYLSLGTARDFRIKGPVLQEALQARRDEARNEGNDDVDIHDAETDILSPVRNPSQNGEEEESDDETSRRKRRRVS